VPDQDEPRSSHFLPAWSSLLRAPPLFFRALCGVEAAEHRLSHATGWPSTRDNYFSLILLACALRHFFSQPNLRAALYVRASMNSRCPSRAW